jgi:hypothetical protein
MQNNHLLSPFIVGFMGLLIFLIIFILAPINPKVTLQPITIAYVLVSYCLFFLGCTFYYLLPKTTKMKVLGNEITSKNKLNRQFVLSIILASTGILFRLIDRFYLRNVSLFQSGMENRELLEQADSGLLSILGALIYPICFVVLFLFLKKNGRLFSILGVFSLVLFFFPTFDSLLFGSRSLILVNMLMLLLILRGCGRLKIKLLQLIYISIFFALLIGVSGYIFLGRLDEMGLNVLDTIYLSGYATTVAPNNWVANELGQGLTFTNTLLFSWLNFTQYYTHGLFEFNNFLLMSVDEHSYGATQFNIVYKLLGKILPLPSLDVILYSVNPRPGVFTTFFGPAHMDFGYFSPFVLFLWGIVSSFIHRKISSTDSYFSVLYYMVVIIIFFMPVVNFIQSAQGLYIIFSVVFFGFVYESLGIILPKKRRG